MTYYPDLSTYARIGSGNRKALAVGWLEADHDYARGDVPPDLIAALEHLYTHGWEPFCAAGWHDCSLCGRQLTDGPLMRDIAGRPQMLGAKNLFVPAGDTVYVAPSLIIHYVEHHSYRPPDELVRPLLALDPASDHYPAECQRLWHGS